MLDNMITLCVTIRVANVDLVTFVIEGTAQQERSSTGKDVLRPRYTHFTATETRNDILVYKFYSTNYEY
jgi:hypothetical protein